MSTKDEIKKVIKELADESADFKKQLKDLKKAFEEKGNTPEEYAKSMYELITKAGKNVDLKELTEMIVSTFSKELSDDDLAMVTGGYTNNAGEEWITGC